MTCPPGSLWSQEDWYQNDQGIILTETETRPQGPWKTRNTIPKGVRSRTAIQYSDSIDQVIQNLKKGNNGLIPNEWLIGDKKTNEIASYAQALYNTPIKRTFNGYYWSCNLPHNVKVLSELTGIPKLFLKLYSRVFGEKALFTIDGENVIWNEPRANTLVEKGDLYYGKIDTENAKKIMTAAPLPDLTTDCKITSSKLMENMGLIAFYGKTNGVTYIPSEEDKKNFKGVTELPPSGWVELYPSVSQPNKLSVMKTYNNQEENSKILWRYETNIINNFNHTSSIISDNVIYAASSSGIFYALDAKTGIQKWSESYAGENIKHTISGKLVFIRTDEGIYTVDKKTGQVKWEQKINGISSEPIVCNNQLIIGYSNGCISAYNIESGDFEWTYEISDSKDSLHISELQDNIIYVGSGKTCYAFDVTNKKIIWKYETKGVITASPRIENNVVYFGSWDGNIYALDYKTGEYKWSFKTGWGIDSTPDISDNMVYVGSLDNNFYALDKENGEAKWFFTCKSAIHSSPVVYGDYVFFGCDDGRFYALNKTNGDLAWHFAPGYSITEENVNNYLTTPILSNPVIEDGVVYFSAKGTIYALDAQTVEIVETEEKNDDFSFFIIVLVVFTLINLMLIIIFLKKRINIKK